MNILEKIRSLFGLLARSRLWSAHRSEDMPETLAIRTLYLVGEESCPWAAALICPCGCAATISLSLVRGDDPSWVASIDAKGRPSIHPSIWRVRGCRSHFHLRQGRIIWAKSAP
jgi:hypothetical protein